MTQQSTNAPENLAASIFKGEDGGSKVLWNTGTLPYQYTKACIQKPVHLKHYAIKAYMEHALLNLVLDANQWSEFYFTHFHLGKEP